MTVTKTRPVSFRVPCDVLETLEAAGKSPAEISRAALAREARLTRQRAALERARARRTSLRFPKDVATLIREDRDRR